MLHSGFNALLRPRSTRFYTQAASLVTHVAKPQSTQPTLVHYPYFVPRNTNGSLPVYTDIRNGGTRYMVLIRNIDGDANVSALPLATDGSTTHLCYALLTSHLVIA